MIKQNFGISQYAEVLIESGQARFCNFAFSVNVLKFS